MNSIVSKIDNRKKNSLKDSIVSYENIYNAIYCLESYVFEKGLLDCVIPVKGTSDNIIAKNDLELFYALGDKYNSKLILEVIQACEKRLNEILDTEKKVLFGISVYFKMKKVEGNKLVYRPMHSARLIDMICMVCILAKLMYDDSDGIRNLSELSKLIPHNFYGNLPSTDVKYLFKNWKNQYKSFSDDVVQHCRTYQNSHRYLTEVCLDIQNFFPTVSPKYLYNLIVNKLSATFGSENNGKGGNGDIETLKVAIAKLLYFDIDKTYLESWADEYYIDKTEDISGFYMNCGIPQGLPQSYFFGNLCMLAVRKEMMRKEIFEGDAYFYVDDSVIYIKSELGKSEFKERIKQLNDSLDDLFKDKDGGDCDVYNFLPANCKKFQENLNYKVQFHNDEKSSCSYIDDADNHLEGIENIPREISKTGGMFWSLDDIDDSISFKKLCAIKMVVDAEIQRLKKKEDDSNAGKGQMKEKDISRLKWLKRYKKYFLYRVNLFRLKTESNSGEKMMEDFIQKILDEENKYKKENDRESLNALKDFLEATEEEIFQSKYRLLIEKLSSSNADKIGEVVRNFESLCTHKGEIKNLYYRKDVENSLAMKGLYLDKYASLKRGMNGNYRGNRDLKQATQFEKFKEFLDNISNLENLHNQEDLKDYSVLGIEKYTIFVDKNSPDFRRKILNAYYSESIGVRCSDDYSFVKSNSKRLCYTELRILLRLRNPHFDFDDFVAFVKNINNEDISNQMNVDMSLLGVLGTFISFVKNPDWIDSLIQTHRITKGLWYNGSKFLNSYTLHNEEHAVTLVNNAVHIVRTIDYFVLKPIDYYILFLSCYLHDISMVIHPDLYILGSANSNTFDFVSEQILKMQNAVDEFFKLGEDNPVHNDEIEKKRKRNVHFKEAGNHLVEVFEAVYDFFSDRTRVRHHTESADFILSKAHSLLSYLEPTLVSFVAKVSESHCWDYKDVYGLKSRAKRDTVSLKYLMILIRLADLFDVANDRVNYHLLRQNISFMAGISRFHWISHLITDKLEFDADYETPCLDEKGNFIEQNIYMPLYDKPITEILIVRLYLNVKYLTTIKNTEKCEGCNCCLNDGRIEINIMDGPENVNGIQCENDKCTLICRWMMKKHEWLVQELRALNEYLYSVNNPLIQTKIKLEIICKNDMKLDADLFDDVSAFLKVE